jgi:hypothetical protein
MSRLRTEHNYCFGLPLETPGRKEGSSLWGKPLTTVTNAEYFAGVSNITFGGLCRWLAAVLVAPITPPHATKQAAGESDIQLRWFGNSQAVVLLRKMKMIQFSTFVKSSYASSYSMKCDRALSQQPASHMSTHHTTQHSTAQHCNLSGAKEEGIGCCHSQHGFGAASCFWHFRGDAI